MREGRDVIHKCLIKTVLCPWASLSFWATAHLDQQDDSHYLGLLLITYEPNLFHQTIQTKYFRLCFLNVTFKDTNLKKRKKTRAVFKQEGERMGWEENVLVMSGGVLGFKGQYHSYFGQKGAKTITKHVCCWKNQTEDMVNF